MDYMFVIVFEQSWKWDSNCCITKFKNTWVEASFLLLTYCVTNHIPTQKDGRQRPNFRETIAGGKTTASFCKMEPKTIISLKNQQAKQYVIYKPTKIQNT